MRYCITFLLTSSFDLYFTCGISCFLYFNYVSFKQRWTDVRTFILGPQSQHRNLKETLPQLHILYHNFFKSCNFKFANFKRILHLNFIFVISHNFFRSLQPESETYTISQISCSAIIFQSLKRREYY
jgi:hypothetical protein